MDFHHLGFKEFNIGDAVTNGLSLKTLKREVAKCVIICSNCHRKVHAGKKNISEISVIIRSDG